MWNSKVWIVGTEGEPGVELVYGCTSEEALVSVGEKAYLVGELAFFSRGEAKRAVSK